MNNFTQSLTHLADIYIKARKYNKILEIFKKEDFDENYALDEIRDIINKED